MRGSWWRAATPPRSSTNPATPTPERCWRATPIARWRSPAFLEPYRRRCAPGHDAVLLRAAETGDASPVSVVRCPHLAGDRAGREVDGVFLRAAGGRRQSPSTSEIIDRTLEHL